MQITLNGEPREISSESLADMLVECGFSVRVATALNEQFVAAVDRAECLLEDGDRVEVLGAMQGG